MHDTKRRLRERGFRNPVLLLHPLGTVQISVSFSTISLDINYSEQLTLLTTVSVSVQVFIV